MLVIGVYIMWNKLLLLLSIVIIILSNFMTYYICTNLRQNIVTYTNFITLTNIATVTLFQTKTITLTITSTTLIPTNIPMYPIKLGETLNIVLPFMYIKNITYYSEDINTLINRWSIHGSYKMVKEGLLLDGLNMCNIMYNTNISLKPYTTYRILISILNHSGTIRFSLYDSKINKHVFSIVVDKNWVTNAFYVNAPLQYRRQVKLGFVKELEFMFIFAYRTGEFYMKRIGIDNEWILVAQIESLQLLTLDLKFALEVCNSTIVFKDFKVNMAGGTGMRDLRPVYDWSNGGYDPRSILKDREGYMLFFATEGYFHGGGGLLILRTKDLVNFEPVFRVTVKQPGYTGQGILFKWIDGRIHGYLMDWISGSPQYQGGKHRILKVVFDENFNLLEINTNVILNGGPPGGGAGHYDITIFKFNRTWYAVTSSFTGGTVLWKLEDPTKPIFNYVTTIFSSGYENPTIYPVIAPNGEIQFMLSVAADANNGACHKIFVLNASFNPITGYCLRRYNIWTAGNAFFLDPWYVFVHQDQIAERKLDPTDLGPGAYIEIYKLITSYRYYIGE